MKHYRKRGSSHCGYSEEISPILTWKQFTIVTDHRPLNWLLKTREPTRKLMRWAILSQSYDFKIEYSPGRLNECANALSRRKYTISTPTENTSCINLPDKLINIEIKFLQRAD